MSHHQDDYSGDPQAQSEPVNPLKIALYALGRFPTQIGIMAIIGALIGFVLAFSQPNFYRSVGMLLVRIGKRELQTPESAIDPTSSTPRVSTATADEMFLLTDPALLERVVRRVGAERILQDYDPMSYDTEATPLHIKLVHELQALLVGTEVPDDLVSEGETSQGYVDLAVETLAGGVELDLQNRSNTILVSYTAHSSELAQTVAATYMEILQERHREFYENSGTYSFLKRRLDEAYSASLKARQDLLAQRQKDGIYNLQSRQDALSDEIEALSKESNQSIVLEESLRRQLVVIGEQLADTPVDPRSLLEGENGDGAQEGLGLETIAQEEWLDPQSASANAERTQYTISTLRSQLQRLNEEHVKLSDEYAPSSVYHQQRSSQLRAKRVRLEGQLSELLQLVGLENQDGTPTLLAASTALPQMNPVYTQLLSTQFDLGRQLEALQVSASARETVEQIHRAELEQLILLEPIYSRLEREVTSTSQQVTSLADAHSQSAMTQLIDSEESMGNLRVIQEPYLPKQKDGPRRAKTLLMGLFGGLGLGAFIALIRQLLDTSLRYPAETETALGIRVLGVIPEQAAWRRAGQKLRA